MLPLSSPQALYTLSMQAHHEGDDDGWWRLIGQCRDWFMACDVDPLLGPSDHAASAISAHSFRHAPTIAWNSEETRGQTIERLDPRGHTMWP